MKRKSIKLCVPTVNDNITDFNNLFSLWGQINDDGLEVTFDFTDCMFLRQNAVAFLGGLTRQIQLHSGTVYYNLKTVNQKVYKNIEENGFLGTLGFGGPAQMGHSIPYREDSVHDKDVLVNYLKEKWLGRDWIHVTDALRDAIVGRMLEIYANAFEHGHSPIGIFSCGQHFPRRRELNLTVVDFGVGIPSNVRKYLNQMDLSADKCMEWAAHPGNTTKPKEKIPGGIGLDLLRDFVKITDGKLEIFSHEGYIMISQNDEKYLSRVPYFEGTLVNIKLHCDSKLYFKLAAEPEQVPLF